LRACHGTTAGHRPLTRPSLCGGTSAIACASNLEARKLPSVLARSRVRGRRAVRNLRFKAPGSFGTDRHDGQSPHASAGSIQGLDGGTRSHAGGIDRHIPTTSWRLWATPAHRDRQRTGTLRSHKFVKPRKEGKRKGPLVTNTPLPCPFQSSIPVRQGISSKARWIASQSTGLGRVLNHALPWRAGQRCLMKRRADQGLSRNRSTRWAGRDGCYRFPDSHRDGFKVFSPRTEVASSEIDVAKTLNHTPT